MILNKEVLLVDGNSILYRSFFSTKDFNGNTMCTKSGVYTNAVHGFLNSFFNLLTKHKFTHIYFAFDKGKKTFRHKMYNSYKANRQETPFELINQFALIRDFLKKANLQYFELDNYEADDILGNLSMIFSKDKENKVYIYSNDKDLYQLLDDNVFIINPSIKSKKLELFTKEDLYNKWSIIPKQIPDFKGLLGDASDNIKGVKGIGEKTAEKLLTKYKSLEELYEKIDTVDNDSIKKKLLNDKDSAFFSKELATIIIDLSLTNFKDEPFEINVDKAVEFLKNYELITVARTLEFNFGKTKKEEVVKYQILKTWDDNLIANEIYLYFETEQENYHFSNPVGFGIVLNNENYYYEPIFDNENEIISSDNNTKGFIDFLLKTNINTYDSKRLLYFLLKHKINIDEISIKNDMKLACYLINSNVKSSFKSNFDDLNIDHQLPDSDVVFNKGNKKSYDIDINLKANYFVSNANGLKKSQLLFSRKLEESNQFELYKNIEIPFSKILAKVEFNGVMVDLNILKILKDNTKLEIDNLEIKIKKLISLHSNEDINLASPKQLQKFLFNTLQLSNNLRQSTDKESLESIIDKHPIVPLLIEYRKISKTYNTYLVGLEKYIEKDNKIRTIYNQTLTSTGRLSSSEPNMQNLSVKDEKQKEIRKIFICNSDEKIISLDYSQIELRIVADIAEEDDLINAFNLKKDIHKETAFKIFNIIDDDITPIQRQVAKTVNFGILYGQSESSLAKELGIDKKGAMKIIENYYSTYSKLDSLQKKFYYEAKKNGYVTTIGNRRRYIPELKSPNFQIKEFGRRVSFNSPIQGTAADIIKVAMIEIDKSDISGDVQIIAQIHDEIIIIAKKKEIKIIEEKVKTIMSDAYNKMNKYVKNNHISKVRLEVNSSIADSWYYLK
ncbi:DNA polymerase I [Spiroplasma endosymbiont of Aspidapion aeneum]|uniref:DNA polymerase I n=1 Tax=Spiroplasma endosymbiont of Aspidapion aeneum TaxID=3066276 RepID=UPI00313C9688